MSKRWLIGLYLVHWLIVGLFWWQNSGTLLFSGSTGTYLALARLAGLAGATSILAQYTLVSTAPWVSRKVGQYRLTNWHTLNGKVAVTLIGLHVLLIWTVYGGPLRVLRLPYVWLAEVAIGILIATVGFAILRNKLPYKVWHGVHLLNYSISALIIWHQLANGGDLVSNSLFRSYWIAINLAATLNLIYYRWLKKIWWRYQSQTS